MTRRIVICWGVPEAQSVRVLEAWGRGATGMQEEKLEGAVSSVKRNPSRQPAREPAWKT